jgi:hypothetical protein
MAPTPHHMGCMTGRIERFWPIFQAKRPKPTMRDDDEQDIRPPAPTFSLMGRNYSLPQSRAQRIALGVGLIVLGTLGFLPVLGFWMIPLGLLVLSYEFASVRRLRRRAIVWWERRKQKKQGETLQDGE